MSQAVRAVDHARVLMY